MEEVLDIAMERFNDGKWEIGGQEAIVFNDGVAILEMTETGPSVEVIAGEYIRKDIDLNLTKKVDEDD